MVYQPWHHGRLLTGGLYQPSSPSPKAYTFSFIWFRLTQAADLGANLAEQLLVDPFQG